MYKRMYPPNEVEISQKYLDKVFKKMKGEVCLLGGWAIYYSVNKNFEKVNGRAYIGSRDIDIGFHIDRNWTGDQLTTSEFSMALKNMDAMGFRSVSFRWIKDFDAETGSELTPEESAKLPMFKISHLYIDPIVDYIHPAIKQVLGFVPIDEPLLSLVFKDKLCSVTTLFGASVLLPKPHVLLAMKLNSVTKRDKEQKKIKDIADVYALLWFSDMNIGELKSHLFSKPLSYSEVKARNTLNGFTGEEIDKVSSVLDISTSEIRRVLDELTM